MNFNCSGKRSVLLFSVLIFFGYLIFYSTFLGLSPFSSKGEAREALVIKDMFEQGNFILPLRNGVDIPSKPPFFHWIAAGTAKLSGHLSEFDIRFPSTLFAALALAFFFTFVSLESNLRTGLVTIVIAATATEWSRSALLSRVDMVFTSLLSLAFVLMYSLFSNFRDGRRIPLVTIFLLGVVLGCAVLTKGPAGIVIPWLAFGLFWLVATKGSLRLPYYQAVLAIATTLLVAGLWYWAAYKQQGQRFIEVQFIRENVARLTGAEGYEVGHEKPFYFGVIDLLTGFLPWSVFCFPAAFIVWQKRHRLWLKEERLFLFSLCWLVTFVIIISVASSKRAVYLLPVYLPLAYILAHTFFALREPARGFWYRFSTAAAWLISIAMCAVLVVALLSLFFNVLPGTLKPSALKLAGDIISFFHKSPEVLLLLFIAVLFATHAALLLQRHAYQRYAMSLGASLFLVILVLGQYIQPTIAQANSARSFAAKLTELIPASAKIVEYRRDFFPMLYYLDRRVQLIDNAADLVSTPPQTGPCTHAIVQENELLEFQKEAPQSSVLYRSEGLAADNSERLVLVSLCRSSPF